MAHFNSATKRTALLLAGASAIGVSLLLAAPAFAKDGVFAKATPSRAKAMPVSGAGDEAYKIIDLGAHKVPVLNGGLYDRYRSNPPLSVIASARPDIDLSWFWTLSKERKDVGFETYSPNFYYSNSSITAVYTADMARLEALIPAKVREHVRPVSFGKGKGLIAITSYSYHYCDNDAYNEVSISIVTTSPSAPNLGPLSLLWQTGSDSMWGYVLKLPVNTELARVRGVVGYSLPKWLIPIEYDDAGGSVTFNYFDEQGNLDFSMIGKKLSIADKTPKITRTNFTNLDDQGRLTHGYSDTRPLKIAISKSSDDVTLALTAGPMSQFIESLGLEKLVRYQYMPEFQLALYTPERVQKP